ncbi:MAG: hypothetical protein AB1772_02855, partial [Candidatus Zixiibacteriota bacterium]
PGEAQVEEAETVARAGSAALVEAEAVDRLSELSSQPRARRRLQTTRRPSQAAARVVRVLAARAQQGKRRHIRSCE